ncbi:MAG: peptidylprolyl isomerase [Bacteriovoracaceae bacterium]|nr:peptidylprolyl isomerase [Bacteriovoracaceae bacterium]
MISTASRFYKILSVTFTMLLISSCFNAKDATGTETSSVRVKTVHGDIVLDLFPDKAPITTARFKELVSKGFYNGLTFHRVIPNFVVQGGDPAGNGTGGSGKKLKAEFNDTKHVKGTLAMARASDINSADSQFYIALGTLPHLDGKYTVFGKVKKGLEVLDKIRKGDKMLSVTAE